MSWHVTMLFVHILAFVASVRLYRAAPCWMQRLFMGMLAAAMAVMSIAYFAALFDADYSPIVRVAGAIENVGLLIYLFRLSVQGMQWTPSSERSHNSLA